MIYKNQILPICRALGNKKGAEIPTPYNLNSVGFVLETFGFRKHKGLLLH